VGQLASRSAAEGDAKPSVFLTAVARSKYTYPAALEVEIEEVVGEYLFDTTETSSSRRF
jgi:hypothetical protein